MNYIGIIPARYASARFPGKPLAILNGKTVIERVYQRVAGVLDNTYVATDDDRIFDAVKKFGGKAVMTSPYHKSGTDRVAEAVRMIGGDYDVVLNIQGDEPFVRREQIASLCHCFDDAKTQIATLGKPFEDIDAVKDPNSPKIVTDNHGYALYFSRSVIPFVRDTDCRAWLRHYPFLKHIGLYAYRAEVLLEITSLPQSSLEKAESLEQLRWLQNGYSIRIATTHFDTISIDEPEDLKRAEQWIAAHPDFEDL